METPKEIAPKQEHASLLLWIAQGVGRIVTFRAMVPEVPLTNRGDHFVPQPVEAEAA